MQQYKIVKKDIEIVMVAEKRIFTTTTTSETTNYKIPIIFFRVGRLRKCCLPPGINFTNNFYLHFPKSWSAKSTILNSSFCKTVQLFGTINITLVCEISPKLSPGSRHLFWQAILQSAAATNTWAMVTKKEAKLRAQRLAEVLKCPHTDVSRNTYIRMYSPQ